MVLSPGSGRKNAPRDHNGHFLPNDYQEPVQDIVIAEEPEVESPFAHIGHAFKRTFLTTYSEVGKVHETARVCGIPWQSHYYWLSHDEEYAKAWKLAERIFADQLEDECTRRGKDGFKTPVFDRNGNLVAERMNYSDLLLIFRTKGALPHKYGDRLTLDIETRVRQVAQELGVDPEEAVLEAQKLLGSGKAR